MEFYRDSIKIGEDTTTPYSYVWTNATTGTYNLSTLAYDNDGLTGASSIVTINVVNTTPQVQIISPNTSNINLAHLTNKELTISANATDPDSEGIARVDSYIDNSLKLTDTAQPYNYIWSAQPGQHDIKVIAKDNSDNSGEDSKIVNIYSMTCLYNGQNDDKVDEHNFQPNGTNDWSWTINLENPPGNIIKKIDSAIYDDKGDYYLYSTADNTQAPIGIGDNTGGLVEYQFVDNLEYNYTQPIKVYLNPKLGYQKFAPLVITFENNEVAMCQIETN